MSTKFQCSLETHLKLSFRFQFPLVIPGYQLLWLVNCYNEKNSCNILLLFRSIQVSFFASSSTRQYIIDRLCWLKGILTRVPGNIGPILCWQCIVVFYGYQVVNLITAFGWIAFDHADIYLHLDHYILKDKKDTPFIHFSFFE